MTMTRVGPFGVGDKLTTAQINAIDLNATYGLDARSGQTASMQAVATCSGAGRIIRSYVAGANANNTYTLSSGCSFINGAAATIAGSNVEYTLSSTGANLNDTVEIRGHATKPIIVKDGPSGAVLATLIPQTGTEKALGEFFFDGTNWQLRRLNGNTNRTRFHLSLPQFWGGTGTIFTSSVSIATDEGLFVPANVKLTIKDLAATLPATTTPDQNGFSLPNPTTTNQGYGYAWWLDSRSLIDGKRLESVVMRRNRSLGNVAYPAEYFRFYIRRVPLGNTNPSPVYLSSASYPGGSYTGVAADVGIKTATLTCDQNHDIDLATYGYMLIAILGPQNAAFSTLHEFAFIHF